MNKSGSLNLNLKKIFIGPSKIHGKGVIAKKALKRGETAFIIKGKLVKVLVHNKNEALNGPDWVGVDKNMWIDPFVPSRYLNHSCNPSCGIKGRVTVVALRKIKQGEEITVDYSTIEAEPLWYMKCNCGSKNCREKIRSVQSLPIKTYKKYLPYVSRYFQEVYDEYHSLKNGR